MHSSSPFRVGRLVPALALALLIGCTGGEDLSGSSFGSSITASRASQASQSSADTGVTTTGASTSGEPTSEPVTATEPAGTTTDDPSAATTTTDPATTDPATTDPATGDPATGDPSTTGVDPSTTTGVDPSTTTGMMDDTTGDPPDPPAKDPQPANGLYETCLDNTPCEPALTDGCFTITDSMTMKVIDGYCTILCANVNDCGPKPNAPATQECLNIGPGQNVCALKCTGVADCPTGMACTGLALPNNQNGMYCT